jgi:hypothetical protein
MPVCVRRRLCPPGSGHGESEGALWYLDMPQWNRDIAESDPHRRDPRQAIDRYFGPAKSLGQGGQDSEIIRVLDPLAGTTGGGHSRIPGRENRMSCGSRPIR